MISTVLLAYRVWTTNRDEPGVVRVLSRRGVEGSLLLRVLVDAAALYTFTLGVLIACYAYQNIGQLIVLDMVRFSIYFIPDHSMIFLKWFSDDAHNIYHILYDPCSHCNCEECISYHCSGPSGCIVTASLCCDCDNQSVRAHACYCSPI